MLHYSHDLPTFIDKALHVVTIYKALMYQLLQNFVGHKIHEFHGDSTLVKFKSYILEY